MSLTFPEKIDLARLETPVQPLPGLSQRSGKNIHIWRDDLTGWELSGNKVRKLEYLCAEARSQGANHLVTCGGPQSNHARATVFAARKLGWDVTVVVREPPQGFDANKAASGNLLLNQILGARIITVSYAEYQQAGGSYERFLQSQAEDIEARGGRPFIIPEGGSCATGCWGYLAAMKHLVATFGDKPFDLFCAVGSGGTLAGLELGRRAFAPRARVHGVNVCDSASYFQTRIGQLLVDFAHQYPQPVLGSTEQPLNLHDGFVGDGYAVASDGDLRFYAQFARETGLLLDPVYTGKAFQGMLDQLHEHAMDLHQDIVFLHSGGQFATFAFAEQYSRALESS